MPETTPSWEVAEGWRRDAIHYPVRPLHPLDVSSMVDTVGPGSHPGFNEWSLRVARVGRELPHWVVGLVQAPSPRRHGNLGPLRDGQ